MDFEKAREAVQAAVNSGGKLPDAMASLFQFCKTALPSPGWDLLAKRDYRSELAAFTAWLDRSLTQNPPGPDVADLKVILDIDQERPFVRLAGFKRAPATELWRAVEPYKSALIEELIPFLAKGGENIAQLGFYVVGGGWLALAACQALVQGGVERKKVLGGCEARSVGSEFAGGDAFILGSLFADGTTSVGRDDSPASAAAAGASDDASDADNADLAAMNEILFKGLSVKDGMRALIDHCATRAPGPGWARLAQTDFEAELPALAQWLTQTLTEEPPADEVDALYLGIYFPEPDGGGEALPTIYLAGTEHYTEEAWTSEPAYEAHDYESKTLRELYKFTQLGGGTITELGENVLCLGWLCLAASALFARVDRALALGNTDGRAVVVGFEGAEYFSMGVLDEQGSQLGTE